jgi:hypothetical protein
MYPTMFSTPGVRDFAEAIDAERARQLAKFGDQRHPDLDPQADAEEQLNAYAFKADQWKEFNARRARDGRTAWDGILLEEVYEALAEFDPALLRAELIQISAVCAAWVSDLDRR